jgi:hypothetical protein
MFYVNPSVVPLGLAGCVLYLVSMSALGRWLAACRESSSIACIGPAPETQTGR